MSYFVMTITTAGFDALVDAQNGETEAIEIVEVGVSDQPVTIAPTLVSLPGEVKRIASVAGMVTSETVIRMSASDASNDEYEVRSFALYLADGTLFAAYSQSETILAKASVLQLHVAFDIAFSDAVAGDITFGDATFLFPPATESIEGIAELATQEEADDGTDDQRIITPLKLAGVLAPVVQLIADEALNRANADGDLQNDISAETVARAAAIAALNALEVTGGGVVTGGGAISANPTLSVVAASAAQLLAGTEAGAVLTPAVFGPVSKNFGQNGYLGLSLGDPANAFMLQWGRFTASANTSTSVSFPIAFAESAYSVVTDGTSDTSDNAQDNWPALKNGSITATGFQVHSANNSSDGMCFIAIGRIDLS